MERNWIRLPLEGADNVRDLGGLPAKDNRQTPWHQFLRADRLSDLTAEDTRRLLAYGVRTVIDLRSAPEVAKRPDSPELLSDVEFHHISFMEEDLSPEGQTGMTEELSDLSSLYLSLLKRKTVIRQLFETIEQAPEGGVLFHCTAGKDRTGVLAMLLLMLAGADRQDCETNYMQSYTNLSRKEKYVRMHEGGYGHLVGSNPEYIDKAYTYVNDWDQGIYGFLSDCGVSGSCIRNVQMRILDFTEIR